MLPEDVVDGRVVGRVHLDAVVPDAEVDGQAAPGAVAEAATEPPTDPGVGPAAEPAA